MSQPRTLPPEFTIYAVSGLRQEWLAWLPDVSTARRWRECCGASSITTSTWSSG